jgi:hypothetical protein
MDTIANANETSAVRLITRYNAISNSSGTDCGSTSRQRKQGNRTPTRDRDYPPVLVRNTLLHPFPATPPSHLISNAIQSKGSRASLLYPAQKNYHGAQMQNAVSETRGDHALTSMVENWRSRLEQRKQGKKPRFHQHLITPNPRKQISSFAEWGKLREEDVRFVI